MRKSETPTPEVTRSGCGRQGTNKKNGEEGFSKKPPESKGTSGMTGRNHHKFRDQVGLQKRRPGETVAVKESVILQNIWKLGSG